MNKEEIFIPPVPRCRPPVREMTTYVSNTTNNTNSSVEYYDSTDSESTTEDELTKSTSSLKEHNSSHNVCFNESKAVLQTSLNIPYNFFNDLLMVICGCLFALLAYNFYFYMPETPYNNDLIQDVQESKGDLIQDFHQSVKDIKLKFKNQKLSTWNAFSSQIEDVINESAQVSMVILLGNETNTVTCLAHALGQISSKALGSNTYLTLNAKSINNDHGEIISRLKAEIPISRAVVVEDLLTVNSKVIQVFHSLCDRENPLVSKAFYIITILSSGYEGSHKDKFVEDRLTAKFSKEINLDILNPLIIRIMDGPIISVLPEPSMKGKKTIDECLLS